MNLKKITLIKRLLIVCTILSVLIMFGCERSTLPTEPNTMEIDIPENLYFLASFSGSLILDETSDVDSINMDSVNIIAVVTFPGTSYTKVKYAKFDENLNYSFDLFHNGQEFPDYNIWLLVYYNGFSPDYHIEFQNYRPINETIPKKILHKDFYFSK